MESTMKPGTAKIMMEYPEVGKLYRVHPWNIVHVPPSFIPSGPSPIDARARGKLKVDLDTVGRLWGPNL
jgi:hypothetical protein